MTPNWQPVAHPPPIGHNNRSQFSPHPPLSPSKEFLMARLVTLFTGQWADLPLADTARKTHEFGYDGIELACWGDHFEVDKALSEDGYCARKRELLEKHDLQC